MQGAITDIAGVRVGHYSDREGITGCTVVLCEKGAAAGVDVRGGAPGTRETDTLGPLARMPLAHAVLLTGGSAFGLDAATGVMRFLEEKGFGLPLAGVTVPIVPAAVIFDLLVGSAWARPDAAAGYAACLAARAEHPEEGSVGAGTGATVGKLLGPRGAVKGGLGTASLRLGKAAMVGALVVVNAFGDVVDEAGEVIAGTRHPSKPAFLGAVAEIARGRRRTVLTLNTTIGVVATNLALPGPALGKVAQMAHNGLAASIRPAHTMLDGDTIFALSTGELAQRGADATSVGALAAEVVARAVRRAVLLASGLAGVPAATELPWNERALRLRDAPTIADRPT